MNISGVKVGIPVDIHRDTSPAAVRQLTRALSASGADYAWLWDELSGWWPGDLWTPQNSPLAEFVDMNSTSDPFIEAALALSETPDIGIRLSTDAIRANPAELMRKMMTLANACERDVVIAVGAGELRQTRPFGYQRREGLDRLEDLLVLVRRLWDEDEPFDFQGDHWTFKKAFLGRQRPPTRPKFYALGGGPKLLDLAARYADGFEAATPQAVVTPEDFAKLATELREKVEGYGRDPDQFGLGVWIMGMIHEDPAVLDDALRNRLMKYFGGQLGRLNNDDWPREGLTSVMPPGWHYAVKWAPFEQSQDEIDGIIDRTPEEMVRKSLHCGSPAQVAATCAEFVDAAADFVGVVDMLPIVMGATEAEGSLRRTLEVCGTIKQHVSETMS
jgi:phthiodiolone/phenolphthiodiolone dimycocerosates ketoreductase